jgi:hypothetical protein
MTKVEINDKSYTRTIAVKDIKLGELFRYEDGEIYIMTDESDNKGNKLGMLITEDDCTLGMLTHFAYNERVTRLDGTISVEID